MLSVGSVFSGIGLLDYGLYLAGLHHSWLCEVNRDRRVVLGRRWPGARILDDVRAVGVDSVPRVDVLAGGFPCKGASTAGKRTGFDHPETVLWREMARAIGELRPRYVLVENVANILALKDGAVWGEVLGDLAALRFDVAWDCIPAAAFGAPHLRDRVVAVATYSAGEDERPIEPPRFRRDGRAGAGGGAQHAPDAGGVGWSSEGRRRGLESGERPTRTHPASPTHADGHGVRDEPEPQRGSADQAVPRRAPQAPADSEGERRPETARGQERGGLRAAARGDGDGAARRPDDHGRGVEVEWGAYDQAIRRWEAVHGSAPKPLVRRVDDGRTIRVERSRLSALGDGVHVYLGRLAGEHIIELERRRCLSAAA